MRCDRRSRPFRRFVLALVGGMLLASGLAPVRPLAAEEASAIRVGFGYGIGFLPLMIADKLKLLERRAEAAAGRAIPVSYLRFSGSAAMQDAILTGNVEVGGYGVPGLLIAWEKTRGLPQEIVGLAGITTGALTLVTSNPAVKSVRDFGKNDRIAMPATTSPQMYLLQMAAERDLGPDKVDALKPQVVSLPHPEAVNALLSRTEVTAYFASAPFTQIVLADPKIHAVLTSEDVFGGQASFLVLAATKRFADQNPRLVEAMVAAIDEAAALIASDPMRAAEIYLEAEPTKGVTPELIAKLLKEPGNGFGAEVRGVKRYADFMVRLGQLRAAPADWRAVFLPVLHGREGS
ncbi:MAG: ABC transporter substrate-binding protein [Proteobacteria bacterium]|nr:ABC transporter substrate-binding protein [Pseudomonadota bacterium]